MAIGPTNNRVGGILAGESNTIALNLSCGKFAQAGAMCKALHELE